MITLSDQLGTTHSFKTAPSRIISLVPSQTELIFDLGQESKLVGLTKFCVHPNHLKLTKKIVGGTKKVNIEKIRLLEPDLIIANKEENTQEIVDELSKICPVWVTDIITFEDSLQMISDFGQFLNCSNEAQKWIDKINCAYLDFQTFIKEKPIRKVAYFIWKKPYIVVGSDNFINELLKINRFENIYEHMSRYPEIELGNMKTEDGPDLILLSSEPFPFKEVDAGEIGSFVEDAQTIFVDGEMFSWYGSRLIKAFNYFKSLHQRLD
jgi:iron complex transport system substrate-binding protein